MWEQRGAKIPFAGAVANVTTADGSVHSRLVLSLYFSEREILSRSGTSTSFAVVPRGGLAICSNWGPVVIAVSVQPAPESTGAGLVKATGQLAVVGAVTMNPTAAVQMARINALQDISECVFSAADTPLSLSDGSFYPMALGTAPGKFLRGALMGNFIVVATGSALVAILCMLWMYVEQLKKRRADTDSARAFCWSTDGQRLLDLALQRGRLPSIYLAVYFVMGPPSLGFAISLLSITPSSLDNIAVGGLALVVLLIYPCCVTHTMTTQFCCCTVPRRNVSEEATVPDEPLGPKDANKIRKGNRNLLGALLEAWCEGTVQWVGNADASANSNADACEVVSPESLAGTSPLSSPLLLQHELSPAGTSGSDCFARREAWRKKYRLYFDDFTIWWYSLSDLWTSVAIGVINGIRVSSKAICAAQLASLLCLFIVVFLMGIYFNPGLSRSLRFYMHFSNAVSLSSCILQLLSNRVDSSSASDVAAYLSVSVNLISILKLLLDVVNVLYRLIASIGKAPSCNREVDVLVVAGNDATLAQHTSTEMQAVPAAPAGVSDSCHPSSSRGSATEPTKLLREQQYLQSSSTAALLQVKKEREALSAASRLEEEDDEVSGAPLESSLTAASKNARHADLDIDLDALLGEHTTTLKATERVGRRLGKHGEYDVFHRKMKKHANFILGHGKDADDDDDVEESFSDEDTQDVVFKSSVPSRSGRTEQDDDFDL